MYGGGQRPAEAPKLQANVCNVQESKVRKQAGETLAFICSVSSMYGRNRCNKYSRRDEFCGIDALDVPEKLLSWTAGAQSGKPVGTPGSPFAVVETQRSILSSSLHSQPWPAFWGGVVSPTCLNNNTRQARYQVPFGGATRDETSGSRTPCGDSKLRITGFRRTIPGLMASAQARGRRHNIRTRNTTVTSHR